MQAKEVATSRFADKANSVVRRTAQHWWSIENEAALPDSLKNVQQLQYVVELQVRVSIFVSCRSHPFVGADVLRFGALFSRCCKDPVYGGYIRVCQLMKSANKAVPGRFRRLS